MAAAFSLTILPYGILSIVKSISPGAVGERSWRAAYILGYVNSMLNPVCYAFGNKRINTVFKKIICNRCKSDERLRRSVTTMETEDARMYIMTPPLKGRLSMCTPPKGKILNGTPLKGGGNILNGTPTKGKLSNGTPPKRGKVSTAQNYKMERLPSRLSRVIPILRSTNV